MNDNRTLLEQIKEERHFIHDLATPLMIAQGMVDAVLSKMDEANPDHARLAKALKALNKMTDILKARREVLIGQTNSINPES